MIDQVSTTHQYFLSFFFKLVLSNTYLLNWVSSNIKCEIYLTYMMDKMKALSSFPRKGIMQALLSGMPVFRLITIVKLKK